MAYLMESVVKVNEWIRSKIVYSPLENPLIIYITGFWCSSKVWQWITHGNATVWEIYWNLFLDVYGNAEKLCNENHTSYIIYSILR